MMDTTKTAKSGNTNTTTTTNNGSNDGAKDTEAERFADRIGTLEARYLDQLNEGCYFCTAREWYVQNLGRYVLLLNIALGLSDEENPVAFEVEEREVEGEEYPEYYYTLHLATEGLDTPAKRIAWEDEAYTMDNVYRYANVNEEAYAGCFTDYFLQAIREHYSNQLLSRQQADTSA